MADCCCRDGWVNAGCHLHGVDSSEEELTAAERAQAARDAEFDR